MGTQSWKNRVTDVLKKGTLYIATVLAVTKKNTNIVQYSIVYYNTIYPSTMIFTVILAYHTTLAYLHL